MRDVESSVVEQNVIHGSSNVATMDMFRRVLDRDGLSDRAPAGSCSSAAELLPSSSARLSIIVLFLASSSPMSWESNTPAMTVIPLHNFEGHIESSYTPYKCSNTAIRSWEQEV